MKRHIRADTHRHCMNAAKEAVVIRFVQDYRQVAKQIAKRQWRLLFETGATDKRKNDDKDLNPVIGAAPVQMARFQVAEQIDGWWANRANEFRAAVQRSRLDAETKQQLHLLNKWNAIHARGNIVSRDKLVWAENRDLRRLAQNILRGIRKRRRHPQLGRIAPRLDQRVAEVQPAKTAAHADFWIRLRLPRHGKHLDARS